MCRAAVDLRAGLRFPEPIPVQAASPAARSEASDVRNEGPRSGKVQDWQNKEKPLSRAVPDSFACRCLERGGSLHALQRLLGQGNVLVTQRYARLNHEALLARHHRLEGEF